MTYEPNQPKSYDPYAAPPVFGNNDATSDNYSPFAGQPQQYQQYPDQAAQSPPTQYPDQQQYAVEQPYSASPYPQQSSPPVYTTPASQFTAPPYMQPPQYPVPRRPADNGVGTTAMVMGILSVTACGVFAAIPAIICGVIGLGKAKRGEATNRGAALTGVILGSISVGLILVYVIIMIVVAANTPGSTTTTY